MVLYCCDICKKYFSLKGDYTRHIKIHEKNNDVIQPPTIQVINNIQHNSENRLECEYCKKTYLNNTTPQKLRCFRFKMLQKNVLFRFSFYK